MAKPPDTEETRESLRDRLIGLGERSFHKSYYPELQSRLDQLERFRGLLDCTLDAILLVELPSGRLVDANASACRQLGYSRERLLTLGLEEIADLDRLGWPSADASHPTTHLVSTRLRHRDGREIPVEIDLSMDDFGGSSYGIVVARDISERLRAEEALRKSEWEKALILESTEELIVYHDAEMRIVWANQAASRAWRSPQGGLTGRFCWEVWHPGASPCQICPIREALRTGHPQKGEITSPDGRVWFLRGYPVRNEAGEPTGVVELCLDITERKKAEEALREGNRIKSEFISTAAHELRTPLTAIQGFSQLLLIKQELPPAERREFLAYIHEKSVALSRIIADLLDIARAESGKGLSFAKTPCRVRNLVREAKIFFRSISSRHRLVVTLSEADSALEVDREKVAEVFENLLSNAAKYSAPGSTVHLFGRPAGAAYAFGISDRGIGMTAEQAAKIFDKFYRADASNTAPAGLGLGMSLVKTIIEAHGGDIRVESRPQEGTTVHFTLPRREPCP